MMSRLKDLDLDGMCLLERFTVSFNTLLYKTYILVVSFRYMFLCNKWLSVHRCDCKTEYILHASTQKDVNDGTQLLNTNINKVFTTDHLWLSVGYRKTRSVFTRVQRLSCCLATIMLSMVASAMWYV